MLNLVSIMLQCCIKDRVFPSDPKEAFRVMKHACVLGDAEACAVLQR